VKPGLIRDMNVLGWECQNPFHTMKKVGNILKKSQEATSKIRKR
jgi:hypothetical protein